MQSKNSSLSLKAVIFIFLIIYFILILVMGAIFLIVKTNISPFFNSLPKNKELTVPTQFPIPIPTLTSIPTLSLIPRFFINFTLDGIQEDWNTFGIELVPGKNSKAISFNNDSSYLKITNTSFNKIKDEFTLSLWINRLNEENSTLAWISDNNKNGFGILIDKNGQIYCRTVDGILGRVVDSSTGDKHAYLLAGDGWHNVSVVMDSFHCLIYIDGAIRTSIYSTHDNIGVTDFNLLTLGGQMFKGYIDDFKLYNYSRSPEEIKQDMMIEK